MPTTIDDVAEHAGVSHTTVTNVIRNYHSINVETRKRVLESIEELGYVPNEIARRLRLKKIPGKTCNIACVIFLKDYRKYSEYFYGSILSGIENEAIDRGYNLLFNFTIERLAADPNLQAKLSPGIIDGVIVVGGTWLYGKDELVEKVISRVGAVVGVDTWGELKEKVDSVLIDKESGVYRAVKYLSELGHRKIGYIGNTKINEDEEDRFAGYKKAIRDLNLEYDESIVEGNSYGMEEGYKNMTKILERANPLPTAFFAVSDLTAIGAINAAKDKGLKVPGDISIISFDNIELGEFFIPALTTMGVNKEEIGRLAVRRLLERIDNPGLKPVKIVTSAELIVRQSCAAPKGQIKADEGR